MFLPSFDICLFPLTPPGIQAFHVLKLRHTRRPTVSGMSVEVSWWMMTKNWSTSMCVLNINSNGPSILNKHGLTSTNGLTLILNTPSKNNPWKPKVDVFCDFPFLGVETLGALPAVESQWTTLLLRGDAAKTYLCQNHHDLTSKQQTGVQTSWAQQDCFKHHDPLSLSIWSK